MIRFPVLRSQFSHLVIPLVSFLSLVTGALILFGWFTDGITLEDLAHGFDLAGPNAGVIYLLIGLASLGTVATVFLFVQLWRTARSLEDVDRHRRETTLALRQSEEGQRLAKFAVDHAGDAIFWANMEQRIVYANHVACLSLGYERDELLALTIADIVPHHDPSRYRQRLALLKTGQPVQYESWHRRKDGTQFPVEVVLNFVEQDGLGYTCAIVRDITARKQTEEVLRRAQEDLELRVEERTQALRESQRQIELILETTAVATWDWNVVTGALRYNEQWAVNRGLPLDEVIPHVSSWSEGVHPDDRASVMRILQEHLDGHTLFYEAEMRVKTAAGEWTWVMDRGRVVDRDAEGKALRMAGIEIDITARKRVEQALRESEARYSSLVSQATDVIYIAGLDGRFTYANAAASSVMGYAPEELIGKHYLDLIRPDVRDVAQQFYRTQLFEGRPSTYFEFPGITKDGREIWFGQQVRLRVSDGRIVGVEAIARNITARKLAEEALLESEERTRAIVETSLDAVITINEHSVVTGWNPQATSVFGYTKEEAVGQSLVDLIIPQRHRDQHLVGMRRFQSTGQGPILNRRMESSACCKDGREIPIELSVTSIVAGGQRVFSAFLRDISERKQAESEIQHAYSQLQAVTRRLAEVEEAERQRIARELHDEFGQVLTSLKFDVAWLGKKLSLLKRTSEMAVMVQKTMAMSESVDGLIQSVRSTAAALRPSVLDDLGLVAALEWLAASFRERTGSPCEVTIDPKIQEETIRAELATTLFRIAQELLTNVMRHAYASKVSLQLSEADSRLCLAVRDDGRGMDNREWEGVSTLGLRGMKERVKLAGGTVSILSRPGEGTEVTAQIPLEHTSPHETTKSS